MRDALASDWSDAEIGYRTQLGAAVTRHEWDPTEPIDHQDEIVYAAAAKIHTRIHAQLGANWLGTASSYKAFVLGFIAVAGAIKKFIGGLGRRNAPSDQPSTNV